MGLWAETKVGAAKPAALGADPRAKRSVEQQAGKEIIRQALNRISSLWDQIETSGGSIAWEWILRGSPHGPVIRAAEGQVDRIGSKGDPAALQSACDAWVASWREGIEGWGRQVRQASKIFSEKDNESRR